MIENNYNKIEYIEIENSKNNSSDRHLKNFNNYESFKNKDINGTVDIISEYSFQIGKNNEIAPLDKSIFEGVNHSTVFTDLKRIFGNFINSFVDIFILKRLLII